MCHCRAAGSNKIFLVTEGRIVKFKIKWYIKLPTYTSEEKSMKRIKGGGGFAKSFLLSGKDLGLWTPLDLGQGGVKVRSQKSNWPVAAEQEQQGRKTSFQINGVHRLWPGCRSRDRDNCSSEYFVQTVQTIDKAKIGSLRPSLNHVDNWIALGQYTTAIVFTWRY